MSPPKKRLKSLKKLSVYLVNTAERIHYEDEYSTIVAVKGPTTVVSTNSKS